MAVLRRLMKAVFFLSEESSDVLVGNLSIAYESAVSVHNSNAGNTSLPSPDLSVNNAQLTYTMTDQYHCASNPILYRKSSRFLFRSILIVTDPEE